jgi:NitT/TauT family transport system substrate-binding protein
MKTPLVGLLSCVLALAACTGPRIDDRNPALVTLKVVSAPFLSFAPLDIAEAEGYFTEQGLQIEFVRMNTSEGAIPLLARGDLDVLAGTIGVGHLNAMARGERIKFVSDKGFFASNGCTHGGLLVRRDLVRADEAATLKGLRGTRIAANRASPSDYTLELLLGRVGLHLTDVKIEDIPSSLRPAAFEQGTIAAATTGEPWITRIVEAGHAVLVVPSEKVLPDFQSGFISYGPSLLERNTDAGRRFMVAYLKGVRQYNLGKTERNLEILAKATGQDRGLLQRMCWPAIRNSGQINVRSVLDFQSWAVKKGYVDRPVSEEVLWDPSFVQYATEQLGQSRR